jgi:hypothetical protein
MARNTAARGVLIAAGLSIGGFFGTPMVTESTTDSCLAVERHVGEPAAIRDEGRGAKLHALIDYPAMPPEIACSYIYWSKLI